MEIINNTAYSTAVLKRLEGMAGGSGVYGKCIVDYFKPTRKHHSAVYESCQGQLGPYSFIRLFWNTDSKRPGRRRYYGGEPWQIHVCPPEMLSEGCLTAMEQVGLVGGVAPMNFALQFMARVSVIRDNDGKLKKWFREIPDSGTVQRMIEQLDQSMRVPFFTSTEGRELQTQYDALVRAHKQAVGNLDDGRRSLARCIQDKERAERQLAEAIKSIPAKEQELIVQQAEIEKLKVQMEEMFQLLQAVPTH